MGTFNSSSVFFEHVLPYLRKIVNKVDVIEGREKFVILPLGGPQPSVYVSRKYTPIKGEKDWTEFLDGVTVEVEDTGQLSSDSVVYPAAEVDLLLLIHSAKKKKTKAKAVSKEKTVSVAKMTSEKKRKKGSRQDDERTRKAPSSPTSSDNDSSVVCVPEYIRVHVLKNIVKEKAGPCSPDTTPICVLKLNWELFISKCVSFVQFILFNFYFTILIPF